LLYLYYQFIEGWVSGLNQQFAKLRMGLNLSTSSNLVPSAVDFFYFCHIFMNMANLNSKKKYHFIYKTTNLKNEKFYIGMHSTNNLNDGYVGSGKRLRYSIRKHGIENFNIEFLEFFDNRVNLSNREKELINEDLLKDPMCMNISTGGIGGWVNNEHQKKASLNNNKKHNFLLKNDKDYYKSFCEKVSKGVIERIKKTSFKPSPPNWLGKKHKTETIEKMKKSKIGYGLGSKNSQFGTCWITNGLKNKKIKKQDSIPNGWKLGRKSNKN